MQPVNVQEKSRMRRVFAFRRCDDRLDLAAAFENRERATGAWSAVMKSRRRLATAIDRET